MTAPRWFQQSHKESMTLVEILYVFLERRVDQVRNQHYEERTANWSNHTARIHVGRTHPCVTQTSKLNSKIQAKKCLLWDSEAEDASR